MIVPDGLLNSTKGLQSARIGCRVDQRDVQKGWWFVGIDARHPAPLAFTSKSLPEGGELGVVGSIENGLPLRDHQDPPRLYGTTNMEFDLEDIPAPVVHSWWLATPIADARRREFPEWDAGHVVADRQAEVGQLLIVRGQSQPWETLVEKSMGVLGRTIARVAEHQRRLLIIEFPSEGLARQDFAQLRWH